ncbi:MAG: HD domain-containing protein [Cyclobacteriaceae bacterium]|nr:HD domain-containing protein [Cyclobacteriaceae bacterium]
MQEPKNILEKAELESCNLLFKLPANMVYHNLKHTREVVKAAQEIGSYANISSDEHEILMLAAWFHDTGFVNSYDKHEEQSVVFARAFLAAQQYPDEKTDMVLACIESTRLGQKPSTRVECILHDADFYHLSKKSYFDKLILLKNERERISGKKIPDHTWYQQNMDFLEKHTYCTEYGKMVLFPKMQNNLARQRKKLIKLQNLNMGHELHLDPRRLKELKKKLKQVEGRPDRGIETMFRLTSRNHLQLSAMADSKANILISVNAIIISIIISGLIKTLDNHPHLVIPTYMILTINVVTIVFAILTLRPNISEGKFTEKDIEDKNTNLLFFGNFHGMTREDYKWGMQEMMSDSNYLYSSLIDDIYFLGKVLGKKYRFLRLSYSIFMYGIIIAVVAFVLSNLMYIGDLGI